MKKLLATTILAAALGGIPAHAQQGPQQGAQGPLQDSPSMQQQQGTAPAGPAAQQADPATIRQMQQALNNQGFDPGAIDGILGQQTAFSLRNFQRAQGLDPTGQPDFNTLSALGVEPGVAGGLRSQSRQQDRQFRELQPQEPLSRDQPEQSPGLSRQEDQSPAAPGTSRPPSINPQSQAPTTGP